MASLQLQLLDDLSQVDQQDWNNLSGEDNPFIEYQFLQSLQEAGCVGADSGWQPRYIVLYSENRHPQSQFPQNPSSQRQFSQNQSSQSQSSQSQFSQDHSPQRQLLGALPFYIKYHSLGEYIFDHDWAEAYLRAGLNYYPKGLVAIPFTPANGRRFLTAPNCDQQHISKKMVEGLFSALHSEQLSSLHILFLTDQERILLEEMGFMTRFSTQFHWENHGYTNFNDYLQELRSARRKDIRKERRRIKEMGIEVQCLCGDEIEAEHIDQMYKFYYSTGQRKWGHLYLNRCWFELIRERFRHRALLILAKHGKNYVAGSFSFQKGKKLYGRYWGASAHFPYLHFELCYYRPIEYAIEKGLQIFEAGAQGEQKFLRGFATKICYSSHWIQHSEGYLAINRFLEMERNWISQAVKEANTHSPVKQQY